MRQVDILGTGIRGTISGKTTQGTYEGLLFSKQGPRSATFPENYILVDVKALNGNHVEEYHSVVRFIENNFSPGSITGDHFLVLENKPLFGLVLPLDDIKG